MKFFKKIYNLKKFYIEAFFKFKFIEVLQK